MHIARENKLDLYLFASLFLHKNAVSFNANVTLGC